MKVEKNLLSVLIVSSSTLLAGFLSYIYHPLMLRYLSIEDFGSFESILSVLNILWVFIAAIGLFYVKQVSNNISNLHFSKAYRRLSLRYLFILSFIVVLVFFLTIPFISAYLDIPYYYFLLLGLTIISSFLAITNTAYLQSLRKFHTIGGLIVSGSSIKLIIGFVLVYLGFGILGALLGFIISQVILFFIGYVLLEKHFKDISTQNIDKKLVLSSFFAQKKQIFQYLFTSVLIAVLMNIDILIVNNIFDGQTTGYYAAISVLAKFLVFLGLSIETVYYPQLVKEKIFPTVKILKLSGYYILLTLGAVGFFLLFGEIMLKLFKEGLEDYLYLLYPLVIYCGLLGYISIMTKTLIAYEKYRVNYILGLLIIGLIINLYIYGDNLLLVTQIFMLAGFVGVIATIINISLIKKQYEE